MIIKNFKAEEKYKVTANLNNNILYITMCGYFDVEDAEYAREQYWNIINKHFKGKSFSILCDATDFKPSTKEAQNILNKMTTDTFGEKIAAWAIVSENFLSKNQIKRLMEGMNFEFFSSKFEAESWILSNLKK